MNKLFNPLYLLSVIAFLLSACIPAAVDVVQAAPAAASYQAVLGKPASDVTVSDFIANNNCASSGSFELCPRAGLALWMDGDQVIRVAYLYAGDAEPFSPYKGELPFGLTSNDSRADVERKLGQPKETHAPQAGWDAGLADRGSSPDNARYWAVYERFDMTVIYNSPSAQDQNAKIHAIFVNR